MVWGCISYNGTGNLIFVDEKINNGVYINILANNLKQSAVKIGLTQYIFNKTGLPATHPRQQEHTSKKMTLNYWNEQLNYRI